MDEEKIIAQAKMKKTLSIITQVFMYLVLIILLTCGILLVCAQSGVPAAVKVMDWLNDKWGIVIGATAMGVMLIILKALISIYNTINNNDAKNEENKAELIEIKKEIQASNNKTIEAIEEFKVAAKDISSRNSAIDTYDAKLENLGDQQGVLFEVMKLFVNSNTNDAKIKSIFKNFEETKLFAKAKQLYTVATDEVPAEKIESAKEVITNAQEVAKAVAPATKEIVRTIFKSK